VNGSDRVTIAWTSGSIKNTWLQVTVKANANTNLPQKAGYPTGVGDVFYFGNAVGDSGQGNTSTSATVNVTDELAARNNPASLLENIPITNVFDLNRDGRVDTTDVLVARNHATSAGNVVRYISLANPPAAPEPPPALGAGEGVIASALAVPGAAPLRFELPRALRLPVATLEPWLSRPLAIPPFFERLGQAAPAVRRPRVAFEVLSDTDASEIWQEFA
jgi:hypothetical protein